MTQIYKSLHPPFSKGGKTGIRNFYGYYSLVI